jgi:hypothetical protein
MDKESTLKIFKDIRDNYIDELPKNRLVPGDKNYAHYKCRWNYMVGVANHISKLISQNILNDEHTIKESREFIDYIQQRDRERLTTKNEINMVNNILDKVIQDIKKTLQQY